MVFTWLLQNSIVEMTGSATKQEERKELWGIAHKRIYFATPQCFNNDVTKGDAARPGACQHNSMCSARAPSSIKIAGSLPLIAACKSSTSDGVSPDHDS